MLHYVSPCELAFPANELHIHAGGAEDTSRNMELCGLNSAEATDMRRSGEEAVRLKPYTATTSAPRC